MATSPQLYHEQVAEFADDWYAFRGLLTPDEQELWDELVDAALERPYLGHVQNEADAKWPIVFSMLVAQHREIAQLRAKLVESKSINQ